MANQHLTPFAFLAETYERVAVPAMFVPEALNLLAIAALQPDEQLLDVACGTGIVARLAAPRLGPTGRVVGLDLNDGMLAVARAKPAPKGAPITWRLGDAQALPFPDAEFDVVMCQNGLQFMPDKRRALQEMRRVLRDKSRLVLSTVRRESGSQAVEATVARYLEPEYLARFREPFTLGDADALSRLFQGTGFQSVDITRQTVNACCPSVNDFLEFTLSGRLEDALGRQSPERRAALLQHAREQLQPYLTEDGLVFPVEMLVAVART
ncbi:MAG: class I SAM-dependent methyltransferase [Chloroflexota bacterium]